MWSPHLGGRNVLLPEVKDNYINNMEFFIVNYLSPGYHILIFLKIINYIGIDMDSKILI